jgi:hypothetical protein
MTWSTLNPISVETRFERRSGAGWSDWRAPGGLGSAVAGAWSWSPERTASLTQPRQNRRFTSANGARLHAPADILQRMAAAAQALGCDESDIWVEAAREWLSRHAPSAAGAPVTSGARQEEPRCMDNPVSARRSRLWCDIDSVLDSLRDTPRQKTRILA